MHPTRARTTPEYLAMWGVVQGCASPDRMSWTNMALLMRVLFTASQVLTAVSKITNAEANTVNLLAVEDF